LHSVLGQATYTYVSRVTKQYNLVLAKAGEYTASEVTTLAWYRNVSIVIIIIFFTLGG